MYQSEYPASSINILSSETLEPNVVSKSPTMAELIDCTSNSLSVKANSIRCSIVSPMPMIPPLHTSIPTLRAACNVSIFCSCV